MHLSFIYTINIVLHFKIYVVSWQLFLAFKSMLKKSNNSNSGISGTYDILRKEHCLPNISSVQIYRS